MKTFELLSRDYTLFLLVFFLLSLSFFFVLLLSPFLSSSLSVFCFSFVFSLFSWKEKKRSGFNGLSLILFFLFIMNEFASNWQHVTNIEKGKKRLEFVFLSEKLIISDIFRKSIERHFNRFISRIWILEKKRSSINLFFLNFLFKFKK